MGRFARRPWMFGTLSAILLLVPFPIAGPVPYWRTFFAWIAFVPLLYGLLGRADDGRQCSLLEGTLAAYGMGIVWYLGNCYWIYQTMRHYGGLPAPVSLGILLLFSLALGLYFAVFGFCMVLLRKSFSWIHAAAAAPFLWTAIEFASAHITRVPWDLLGYSQVDNFLLTEVAPWAGVFGISFVLMAGNALIASGLLSAAPARRWQLAVSGLALALLLQNGYRLVPAAAPREATAILVQFNLSVDQDNLWPPREYEAQVADFIRLSERSCGPYLAGMPELDAYPITPNCPAVPASPDLVVWPESPAPFRDKDPRYLAALREVALATQAAVISGNIGVDRHNGVTDRYNSALFIAPDGGILGRYDKIHLVPWGEYVPYKKFFAFAGNLTQQAGDLTHGWRRVVFSADGHTYGTFICYEEIFPNEVRQFVRLGAEALVNISDDGWYGDTSAPWQTLNMARMRAIENRRWLLRDTNTGITTIIDPYGRMTASIGRHTRSSLAAKFGYSDVLTFYTVHGDLFAELCGIISLAALAIAFGVSIRSRARRQIPSRSDAHAERT